MNNGPQTFGHLIESANQFLAVSFHGGVAVN
jgi:hypothetical protein